MSVEATFQAIGRMSDDMRLNAWQRKVLARLININGTGEHPWAETSNLDSFSQDYALKVAMDVLQEIDRMYALDLLND